MDIQSEKIALIQWISFLSDEKVIQKLKSLRDKDVDWWEDISEAEKTAIKEGIKQADEEQLLSHEEVMKNPRKWHSK